MTDVLIPDRELGFLLWEWLRVDRLLGQSPFEFLDRETVEAMLDLSARLAEDAFLSHYKEADREEPFLDADGSVHVLPAIGEALRRYAELGLFGAGFPEELGGLHLPGPVVAASMAQFMAANIATSAYPMLTAANARLIATFGTPAQIDAFARPQIEGRDFGTMCLSEPQAGSSLADIRTSAHPEGEDALGRSYRLTGNKMWISGGDQNITDNIVHLVLAKVPGEDNRLPEGTKGISLFIVPKILPGGERNDVAVAGLNHKMGYRGTANCLLNFGEGLRSTRGGGGAVGYLVGQEGHGLAMMFQMMNEARINVGLGAAAVAYRGFRHALSYARERTQGRPAGSRQSEPVPIITHPDVQRMLLAQKAYAEGALALVLYCSMLVDRQADDDAVELLALLTPVAKTWPSEWGLAANDLAIQVHGGYGYTRDFDVEQLYRDNRLNPIHEGTTGIQALDLLGRKLLRGDGRALAVLASKVRGTVAEAYRLQALTQHAKDLDRAWSDLEQTVVTLQAAPDAGPVLANATVFLQGFGHVVLAWLWLDMALACGGAASGGDAPFYAGKLRACRFFFECELPKTRAWFAFVTSMSDVAAGVPADHF